MDDPYFVTLDFVIDFVRISENRQFPDIRLSVTGAIKGNSARLAIRRSIRFLTDWAPAGDR
jgi:hypothetical protein